MGDQNQPDAWALSGLGYALGAYVDREINKPIAIQGSGQYGVDEQGNLYNLGQPAGQVVTSVSTGRPGNSTMLLLILAVAFLASRH